MARNTSDANTSPGSESDAEPDSVTSLDDEYQPRSDPRQEYGRRVTFADPISVTFVFDDVDISFDDLDISSDSDTDPESDTTSSNEGHTRGRRSTVGGKTIKAHRHAGLVPEGVVSAFDDPQDAGSEPDSDSSSEVNLDLYFNSDLDPYSDPDPESEPDAESDADGNEDPDPNSEPDTDSDSDNSAEREASSEPDSNSDSDNNAEREASSEPDSNSDSDSGSESDNTPVKVGQIAKVRPGVGGKTIKAYRDAGLIPPGCISAWEDPPETDSEQEADSEPDPTPVQVGQIAKVRPGVGGKTIKAYRDAGLIPKGCISAWEDPPESPSEPANDSEPENDSEPDATPVQVGQIAKVRPGVGGKTIKAYRDAGLIPKGCISAWEDPPESPSEPANDSEPDATPVQVGQIAKVRPGVGGKTIKAYRDAGLIPKGCISAWEDPPETTSEPETNPQPGPATENVGQTRNLRPRVGGKTIKSSGSNTTSEQVGQKRKLRPRVGGKTIKASNDAGLIPEGSISVPDDPPETSSEPGSNAESGNNSDEEGPKRKRRSVFRGKRSKASRDAGLIPDEVVSPVDGPSDTIADVRPPRKRQQRVTRGGKN